jgi:alpha-tubulin suppressor-like RCC1 family protein
MAMLVRRIASRVVGATGSRPSKSDAYLVSFGMADDGRLGLGVDHAHDDSTAVPTHVPFPGQSVRQVSCGGAHTVALMTGGSVYAFGLNDEGQCGQAPEEAGAVWQAEEVLVPEDVDRVASGFRHSLAVGKERVWRWGGGSSMPRVVPLPDGAAADVVDVAAGDGYSILVTKEGRALLYGEEGQGAGGCVELSPGRNIVKASAGHFHAALCDDQGNVQLVHNVQAQLLSRGSRVSVEDVDVSHPVRDVACGGGHTLLSLVGGGVMAWGQGDALGLGDGEGRKRPTRIVGLDGAEIVKVAAGWRHSMAIDHAGRLFAWGWGGSQGGSVSLLERRGGGGGQLGLGDDCDAWEPRLVERIRMGGLEIGNEYWRAVDVSLGINHSCCVVDPAR